MGTDMSVSLGFSYNSILNVFSVNFAIVPNVLMANMRNAGLGMGGMGGPGMGGMPGMPGLGPATPTN